MSKKRGLSADDKRAVLLKIYHQSKEPFNLKEIESLGSKAGVVMQTIKDINQSLTDDSFVLTDKIGSANFFWSFPCKMLNDKVTEKTQLESSITQLTNSTKEYENLKEKLLENRIQSSIRTEKLNKLELLLQEDKELDSQLECLKMNDPERIIELQKQALLNLNSANRWTDNV